MLAVGAGGAAGSILRYGLSLAGQRWSISFPHGTLWANLLGCLLLRFLLAEGLLPGGQFDPFALDGAHRASVPASPRETAVPRP